MRARSQHNAAEARPVRAVLAEDHVLLRELLFKFLSEKNRCVRCVAAKSTIASAVTACVNMAADLLIVRLALLESANGAPISELRKRLPNINILLYSGPAARDIDIIQAMRSYVNGHIGKTATAIEFLNAIDSTRKGKIYFCRESNRLLAEFAAGRHQRKPKRSGLSPRQTEILRLIADGRTSKEIAQSLHLSVATVDTHRRNLMSKTGAHNAADLIRYGHKFDLIKS